MQQITISDADVKNMTAAFKQVQALGPQDEFCKLWPTAKKVLSLLQDLAGAIPGFGSMVKAAISIAIAAGDAASSAFCKS